MLRIEPTTVYDHIRKCFVYSGAWSDAGPADRVRCWLVQYIAESPKQGSKRFNFITRTIQLYYLSICTTCTAHKKRIAVSAVVSFRVKYLSFFLYKIPGLVRDLQEFGDFIYSTSLKNI